MEPLIIKVTLNTEYHLIIKIVGQTENCETNMKTVGKSKMPANASSFWLYFKETSLNFNNA